MVHTKSLAGDMPRGIEEHARFERLLCDLSAAFVDVPAGRVDAAIVTALGRIVEFLDLDRSTLVEVSEDRTRLVATHCYARPRVPILGEIAIAQCPWIAGKAMRREIVRLARIPDDLPPEAAADREFFVADGLRSCLALPLPGKDFAGLLSLGSFRTACVWTDDVVERLHVIAGVFANALARKKNDLRLSVAFDEIRRLKEHLRQENLYLRAEVEQEYHPEGIIGASPALRAALSQVRKVARTGATVLLVGETGTGKELLARAVHNLSPRKARAMVKVNCAALPATLVENELFGRERGAYTGATTRHVGRFEVADGSTIFLDEVGDLPVELQPKLLRVLQEGEFERLGGTKTVKVDVRVVAATNRDLSAMLREGRFREDLYFRLNVFPVAVPPLRERREDIPALVRTFVAEFAAALGRSFVPVSVETMAALETYSWPGNIRELRNVVERAMILSDGGTLHVELPEVEPAPSRIDPGLTLEAVERRHIADILERCGWRIRGRSGAAAALGLKPTTLEWRLRKLGIHRPGGARE